MTKQNRRTRSFTHGFVASPDGEHGIGQIAFVHYLQWSGRVSVAMVARTRRAHYLTHSTHPLHTHLDAVCNVIPVCMCFFLRSQYLFCFYARASQHLVNAKLRRVTHLEMSEYFMPWQPCVMPSLMTGVPHTNALPPAYHGISKRFLKRLAHMRLMTPTFFLNGVHNNVGQMTHVSEVRHQNIYHGR